MLAQREIDFSRPGKPTDNAFVESFNGTFRSECLNIHWFMDMKEAKQLIEAWKQEYNESRPHASLDDRTPSEFAKSRIAVHISRTKFLLKFVRDICTKMTLSLLSASLSVRKLSANSSANSGN